MKTYRIPIGTLTFLVFLIGCVPARKYQALELAKAASESEVNRLHKVEQAYQVLQGDFEKINQNYEENGKALRELVSKYDRLNESYHALLEQYDKLIDEKQQVIQNSSEEMNRLQAIIQEKDQQIEMKQREIWDKEMELENRDTRLAHLAEAMDPRDLQVKSALENWDIQQLAADSLRSNLVRSLSFVFDSVETRSGNGKVQITLPQSILFSPGSNILSESGIGILQAIVGSLEELPEWKISVIGHTSNEGGADFNWDLSVEWASEVVKEMVRLGMQPARLIASGQSFYHAAYPEVLPDENVKNRRIVILIQPVEDLWAQHIGSE